MQHARGSPVQAPGFLSLVSVFNLKMTRWQQRRALRDDLCLLRVSRKDIAFFGINRRNHRGIDPFEILIREQNNASSSTTTAKPGRENKLGWSIQTGLNCGRFLEGEKKTLLPLRSTPAVGLVSIGSVSLKPIHSHFCN